jgi:plastocyanin
MRRLALILVALGAIAGLTALPSDAGADRLSFVQVVEKEFTLTPSRPSVRTGSVSIELVNFGMDNHNLVIKSGKPGTKPVTFKQLAPRGRAERTLKLSPGRYSLWCSVSDHRARGMHSTLVVTK